MPTASDWRSQAIAGETANLDYADFAQEFLRRNEHYKTDYHAMVRSTQAGAREESACAELAQRWGLVFPFQPLCLRCKRTGPVAR